MSKVVIPDHILNKVDKPARYIGGEVNSFNKNIEEYNQNMYTKYIDYDKIKDGLSIRTRVKGDKIDLTGGNKKLKKLFVEEKIPLDRRDEIPLIVDGDKIVYVVGSRLSSSYYIDANTTNVLEISILQNK